MGMFKNLVVTGSARIVGPIIGTLHGDVEGTAQTSISALNCTGNSATASALRSPNDSAANICYLDWSGETTSCDYFGAWDDNTYAGKPTVRAMSVANAANTLYNQGRMNELYCTLGTTQTLSGEKTFTGRLITAHNRAVVNFRAGHNSYDGTISYQTAGDEALVFATKNAVTSFMFVNGEDSISNATDVRWKSLTPGLQVKNNKVAISKLIPNGTTPTYNLDVAGTIYSSDLIRSATGFRIGSGNAGFKLNGSNIEVVF